MKNKKLKLKGLTLRNLTSTDLIGANGGFSDPGRSCDSCTNCDCRGPTYEGTCNFCPGGLTQAVCSAAPPCVPK